MLHVVRLALGLSRNSSARRILNNPQLFASKEIQRLIYWALSGPFSKPTTFPIDYYHPNQNRNSYCFMAL